MDERTARRRRRLVFGSAIGGVLLVVVGTSVIFAGYPGIGIALVATSVLGFVGAAVLLLRYARY